MQYIKLVFSQVFFVHWSGININKILFLRKLKEARKKAQEDNVKRKAEAKEEHKQKSLKGMKKEDEDSDDEEDINKGKLYKIIYYIIMY